MLLASQKKKAIWKVFQKKNDHEIKNWIQPEKPAANLSWEYHNKYYLMEGWNLESSSAKRPEWKERKLSLKCDIATKRDNATLDCTHGSNMEQEDG